MVKRKEKMAYHAYSLNTQTRKIVDTDFIHSSKKMGHLSRTC